MIPTHFVQLEQIPLTASGKVDRRSLVFSGTSLGTGVEYVSPRSGMEKKLVEIWAEVLGGADHLSIGIHDNFFDMGGNSFSLIRLNSRLKEVLKKDIPMVTLFNYPTISSLAHYLSGGAKGPGKKGLRSQ
jgi:acyl carrier protein